MSDDLRPVRPSKSPPPLVLRLRKALRALNHGLQDAVRTNRERAWRAWRDLQRTGRNARAPQRMLAYARDYANEPGADVVVRVRAGELATSQLVTGYALRDLRTGAVRRFNLARAGRAVDVPPPPRPGRSGIEHPYPDTLTLAAADLPESEYELRVVNAARQASRPQYFIVRDSVTPADIGVIHPIFTWHAYNRENGGSLYVSWEHFRSGKARVSLNRPLNMGATHHSIGSVMPFIKLAGEMGLRVKSLSSLDVHDRPELLAKCKVLLIPGHDEYWTDRMRANLAAFIRNGGCVAVFSGNVGWWAVRLNGREIYVDKSERPPGARDTRPYSGQFRAPWIATPQQQLFGLSYHYGGYPVQRARFSLAARLLTQAQYDASGDLVITQPDHPAFEGLGWTAGTRWGGAQKALGTEIDGVFIDPTGAVDRARVEQVPPETRVLAKALGWLRHRHVRPDGTTTARLHFEEVGIAAECRPFPGGGVTVQFGSIGWYRTLAHPDGIGRQITRNVIGYLLKRHGDISRAREGR